MKQKVGVITHYHAKFKDRILWKRDFFKNTEFYSQCNFSEKVL